ncbi:MAG: DUF2634 domain-containing protein [Candidatus Gastranaerophilales bacterium]|nr:DUF2634 domain-containing protein [Candidatus Gastranaerophilales bacterium]
MFPSVIEETEDETQSTREKVISTSTTLGVTPSFDFENKKVVLVNGSPKMISDVDAIRQWIILFITTPKNTYDIYSGTDFGTSIRKLFGRKLLNNGYEESEVEREIREGLPLCPAINRVTSFNMTKSGKNVVISIQVELYDGTLIDESVDISYLIK